MDIVQPWEKLHPCWLPRDLTTTPWTTHGQGKYMEDLLILPNQGELLRRISPDGEAKQETNVNSEPASSTSPSRDLPLDLPPGLGSPLPSSSDPPAGTTMSKREKQPINLRTDLFDSDYPILIENREHFFEESRL